MLRLRKHVSDKNWHLDEQIDRNSGILFDLLDLITCLCIVFLFQGVQISAEDLTWSYAEVLNAMHSRNVYMSRK
jgi:hypothetical protein